jgi:hypothetical protein
MGVRLVVLQSVDMFVLLRAVGFGALQQHGEGGGLPQGVGVLGDGRRRGGPRSWSSFPGRWVGGNPPRRRDSSACCWVLDGEARRAWGTRGPWKDPNRSPPLDAPSRPPFRNLLCTDERVSVKLLRSVLGVAAAAERPLLPRPFGVRLSRSLVGESQNLRQNKNKMVKNLHFPFPHFHIPSKILTFNCSHLNHES